MPLRNHFNIHYRFNVEDLKQHPDVVVLDVTGLRRPFSLMREVIYEYRGVRFYVKFDPNTDQIESRVRSRAGFCDYKHRSPTPQTLTDMVHPLYKKTLEEAFRGYVDEIKYHLFTDLYKYRRVHVFDEKGYTAKVDIEGLKAVIALVRGSYVFRCSGKGGVVTTLKDENISSLMPNIRHLVMQELR